MVLSSPPNSSVQQILNVVVQPEYWTSLNPDLTINGNRQDSDSLAISDEQLARVSHNMIVEGYFQIDQLLAVDQVRRLAHAVIRLHERQCPPVFVFVYDEFWMICVRLAPLLRTVLTDDYRQLPDFWVWYVDPKTQATGWRPHRDKGFGSLLPDGAPKSLTMWIPLTDATPLNGCIYVVPAHLDPSSLYVDKEDKRMPENLQDVRALPIAVGGVLGWNQAILHWGGRSSQRAPEPRISFACEFQRGDVEPYNRPLLDPHQPPPFEQRLGLIGKQVLQYRHMYGFSDTLSSLGEQLTKRFLR